MRDEALTQALSRALLVLRITLGLFLLQWGVEKFVVPQNTVAIWGYFYGLNVPQTLGYVFGAVEIAIAGCLFLGLFRTAAYGAALALHAVSHPAGDAALTRKDVRRSSSRRSCRALLFPDRPRGRLPARRPTTRSTASRRSGAIDRSTRAEQWRSRLWTSSSSSSAASRSARQTRQGQDVPTTARTGRAAIGHEPCTGSIAAPAFSPQS